MRTQRSGRGLHNVPAELTSFVGRRRELAEIKRRLGSSRLVTLTGPGGVGKTRLALRAAAEVARAFPDGVWLVPLASIQDPLLIAEAAFNALGVQNLSAGWSLTTLADYLVERHLLLIFDNCEHLLDSSAVLASTLLKSCPELRLLATSREPLGTAGEDRMLVPPMSLPEEGDGSAVEHLLTSDAVLLLSQRAAAVVPGFAIDRANAAAVLRLCRRLDGIPLALELAAMRLGSLSLDQLNQGLAQELGILGRGNRGAESRQQTLEATIGWSYGLLEEPERLLWARLSVFAGGFDQEAAIDVCSDVRLPSDRIVDLLGALVEKSILKRDLGSGDHPRYWLLDTLRQYGRMSLRELGEEPVTQKRHFEWIRALGRLVGAWDSRQVEMFDRMHRERDNLWTALDFCLRQPGEAEAGAELAQHLMAYWASRGPWSEVRRVLNSLIEVTPEGSLPRARLFWVAAIMAITQNDYGASAALTRDSLRIGTELKDVEVEAWSLVLSAFPLWIAGDLAEAEALAQSGIDLAGLMHLEGVELDGLATLCGISLAHGELDRAIELGERGVSLSRERGELWLRGYLFNFISQASWLRGDKQLAEAQAKEGAACKHSLDDRQGLATLLETLAWMAAERGAHGRAATIIGSAERVRNSSTVTLSDLFRPQHDRSVALALQGLGQKAFDAGFARGRAMTIDEGVAFAVDEKTPAKPPPPPITRSTTILTKRELEISALVTDGLSNKQIAAQLVISERTAEYHILNILNKLGFNSRAQIASWAATHEPVALTPKG